MNSNLDYGRRRLIVMFLSIIFGLCVSVGIVTAWFAYWGVDTHRDVDIMQVLGGGAAK